VVVQYGVWSQKPVSVKVCSPLQSVCEARGFGSRQRGELIIDLLARVVAQMTWDAQSVQGKRIRELTEGELTQLRDEVEKYTTEGDLRRFNSLNIRRLKEIQCYRGKRHIAVRPSPASPFLFSVYAGRGGGGMCAAAARGTLRCFAPHQRLVLVRWSGGGGGCMCCCQECCEYVT